MLHAEFMTPCPKLRQLIWPNVVRELVVPVHVHDANLLAEMADALVQHDFPNHATAVTYPPLVDSLKPTLPVQALETTCHVGADNHQDGTSFIAANDQILEGFACSELIRNCG